jgi:hypothetical protein
MNRSPSPFLCLTGLSYLLPAYIAYTRGHYWTSGASVFLASTSVGFHWTHREDILAVDRLAILQYFACAIYESRGWSAVCTSMSVVYCLVAYFLGQQCSTMCFDPNPSVQSLFHAMIHLSTATAAVLAVA